ncbi:HAD family hydrolase [Barrientosiimonas humi]|uniref:HAD family hydrolase n=1 Tax=Barrientosiimonas humi TaxID=999931 RepID=UPI00370DD58A
MPWLIALDIDGTTIDHDGHLADRVRRAVRAVVDAGHHVVLSTGRTVMGTLPIAEQLGLTTGFAICSNGAVTITLDPDAPEGYRLLRAVTFDPAPVLERLRGVVPDGVVAVEQIGVGHKVNAPFPDGELMGDQQVVDWAELAADPVTRVTFRSPGSSAEEFVELVERLGLHGVNYAVGYTAWLDINPEGVSKGTALEQVREELDVDPQRTLAVGDQRNDLEMLRWAARGVAMGQAPDEVVAAADEVTAPVEQDGLALVLEGLVGEAASA